MRSQRPHYGAHQDTAAELQDVILVSLRHSKAPVSMKRFQSVHLRITHEKFLKENPAVFTHTYTEMHFKCSLVLSLATSQEPKENSCTRDVAAASGLVSDLQSC